jgi:7,8-dihydroneopterin aldolase/epimerase/oxygenase
MIEISLQAFFSGYHGVHHQEQETGNEFEINLLVKYNPEDEIVTSLHDTIDYTTLHQVVKRRMDKPEKLLETIVMTIAHDIFEQFDEAKEVYITLQKLHAAIPNFRGRVGVSYQLKR